MIVCVDEVDLRFNPVNINVTFIPNLHIDSF